MRVLLTGATGFVGAAVAKQLLKDSGNQIVAAVRRKSALLEPVITQVVIGDLHKSNDWSGALKGVDIVVHIAARAHIMNDTVADPLAEFRKVNRDATLNLAGQAAAAGVKRFIFISSIKVNGESTTNREPFSPDDTFITSDPYGVSKREAEQGLSALAKETGMEVVIIRPPLIYGPGVKANFRSLLKWMSRGVPLPLGAIHNKRSLVALDNLVSFIIHCMSHPMAASETFLISDEEDVSTTELLQKIANSLGKKALLMPVPVALMAQVAKLLGKGDVAERLFGSLQVDSSKARDLLGWQPVVTMDEQLKKTAEAYLNETRI